MRYVTLLISGLVVGGVIVWGSVTLGVKLNEPKQSSIGILVELTPTPTYPAMERYSFDTLSSTKFASRKISVGEQIQETDDTTSFIATVHSEDGKVTGLLNIPNKAGTYPVIVMFRGFVDSAVYETGVGTKRAGEVFAENGFITFAPDFFTTSKVKSYLHLWYDPLVQ
jgi:hypothetical protein